MIAYILWWCLLVSGLSLAYFLLRRLWALRRGDSTFHLAEPSIHVFIKPTIDYSAFQLVIGVKVLFHRLSLYGLMLVGRGLSLMRYIVVRLEARFSRIINSVRGQSPLERRGRASVFLREIDEHKQALRLSRETN